MSIEESAITDTPFPHYNTGNEAVGSTSKFYNLQFKQQIKANESAVDRLDVGKLKRQHVPCFDPSNKKKTKICNKYLIWSTSLDRNNVSVVSSHGCSQVIHRLTPRL